MTVKIESIKSHYPDAEDVVQLPVPQRASMADR